MKRKRGKDQKGVTLLEVLICVIIVLLVISPLTLNFVTAGKNKKEAQNITAATNNAEMLMKAVKEQLNADMAIKQKIDGNLKLKQDLTSEFKDEKKRFNKLYKQDNAHNPAVPAVGDDFKLEDYLLTQPYKLDTHNFAYQVVIWPEQTVGVSATPGGASTKGQIDMKAEEASINQKGVIRLYSDPNFKFTSDFYQLLSDPVTFKSKTGFNITDEAASTQEDKITIPSGSETTQYVKVKHDLESTSQYIVDANDTNKCYGIRIPVTTAETQTLVLDVTDLLRNVSIDKDYTFEVENGTGHHLEVRVIRSYDYAEGEDKDEIDSRFHWVAISGKAAGTATFPDPADKPTTDPETVFNFTDTVGTEQNYIVAVFVREKNAFVGDNGKIIKKMVDIFSYDPAYGERW